MRSLRQKGHTRFVSFSGIDGAGKSTQIEALRMRMEEDGLRVVLIRFWDDIAQLTQLRKSAGHTMFKGDKGVGTPSAPIKRRDKNVKSSLMTCVRLFTYCIDAVSIRVAVKRALRSKADLVIFDRYIYDELANLPLGNPAVRAYVWLIMKLVPQPDISYFLDADPAKARARKPEYPLEFLYANRLSYLALSDMIGGFTIIGSMPIPAVERSVLGYARRELSFRTPQQMEDDGLASSDDRREPVKLDQL